MGIIYLSRNLVNGKAYVGQTVSVLDRRRYEHEHSAITGSNGIPLFFRAIRKYGVDAFEWSVLFDNLDDEDLDVYEVACTRKSKILYPNGYNLRSRGSYGRHSDESKRKISVSAIKAAKDPEIKLRRIRSARIAMSRPEVREKLSRSAKLRFEDVAFVSRFREIHRSDEVCKKRSLALKGRSLEDIHGKEKAEVIRRKNSEGQKKRSPEIQKRMTNGIIRAMNRPEVREKIRKTKEGKRQKAIEELSPFICEKCGSVFTSKSHYTIPALRWRIVLGTALMDVCVLLKWSERMH